VRNLGKNKETRKHITLFTRDSM